MCLSTPLENFRKSLWSVPFSGDKHNWVVIADGSQTADLNEVTIRVGKGDWFCFFPDRAPKCVVCDGHEPQHGVMSPLLACGKEHKHHCACDAVIVHTKPEKLTVVFIELKSGRHSACDQFKSTRQFVLYALGLLQEFGKGELEMAKESYVVFRHKHTIDKRPTKVQSNWESPDHPRDIRIKNGKHIDYIELISPSAARS